MASSNRPSDADAALRARLLSGGVIPAHPLALTAARTLDERRQRALTRYYLAAGSAGVAVAVHTTQFAIRDPKVGLLRPVLELAMDELRGSSAIRVAGVVGPTRQALAEAEQAAALGYECGLLSLGAMRDATTAPLLQHCREVAEAIPLVGFYLQPAVGGRQLTYDFWRGLLEVERVVAIKVAPFNRYQTLDVLRAVADSGRTDVALYTGNDDSILADLLTEFRGVRFVGGLLGHWSVWTRRAVELVEDVQAGRIGDDWPQRALEITDSNAALFDPQHDFHGCIAGLHEVLRRQGMLEGRWCLDSSEDLSPGQAEQIDRVCRQYPHLTDDAFVAEHRDGWLR